MSGWSTITLKVDDERIYECYKEFYGYKPFMADKDRGRICYRFSGYCDVSKIENELEKFLEYLDDELLNYFTYPAVIIQANDTSDSGTGYVYNIHPDEPAYSARKPVETFSGKTPHVGQDAANKIYDTYGIFPLTGYRW